MTIPQEISTHAHDVALVECTIRRDVARMFVPVTEKTVGPVGRVAREPGQSLTAAAISGVVRASVSLAVFPATE
jgi:molybdenum cofactor biosynthesis enzyme